MKKQVSTHDYVEYRDRSNACRDVRVVNYILRDRDTGQVLAQGALAMTDEARQVTLGTHPTGGWNSSAVSALLDLYTPELRKQIIPVDENGNSLADVPMPEHPLPYDPVVIAHARRVKGITWSVTHIDEEAREVWVGGVI